MSIVTHESGRGEGLGGALRRLRDPLLLFVLPVTFAILLALLGYAASWPIGFDFRGTLWEPARAFLDGTPIYPEPTRAAVDIGNPTVYPPLFILASVPLALLSAAFASWVWFFLLACCVFAAMWIVGLRDWRCHVLAIASPVAVHGYFFGNLTVALVVFVALAWRYRDRAWIGGLAVGTAIAAKLFVVPLVVWLLLTRRFLAAAVAAGSAIVLIVGAWALIGFEGFREYPSLLRLVQEVYAIRSVSVPAVAASFGASVDVAIAIAGAAGIAGLAIAAWIVRHGDGDRRAFALVVAVCIVASPIVWVNYTALLFVPIAITWPRLAPAWFFGYVIWLAGAEAPKPAGRDVCCRPPDVTEQAWFASHAEPALWFPAATMAVVVLLSVAMFVARREPREEASRAAKVGA